MEITGKLFLGLGTIEVRGSFEPYGAREVEGAAVQKSADQFAKLVGMLARPEHFDYVIAALELERKRGKQ